MPIGFFISHGLDGGDNILKLRNLPEGTPGGHPVVFGHREDEITLMGLQAVKKGVELVGHQVAAAVTSALDNSVDGHGQPGMTWLADKTCAAG